MQYALAVPAMPYDPGEQGACPAIVEVSSAVVEGEAGVASVVVRPAGKLPDVAVSALVVASSVCSVKAPVVVSSVVAPVVVSSVVSSTSINSVVSSAIVSSATFAATVEVGASLNMRGG